MYINSLEENILEDEVKEIKLTKGQKEFIGMEFPTPKGRTLTVTGVVWKSGNHAVFSLECSVCGKDEELFPKGSIRSLKSGLVRGQTPCGCSYSPQWTERQIKVRVEREYLKGM